MVIRRRTAFNPIAVAFLRTTLPNRQIADTVREVNIRKWTVGLVHRRSPLVLDADDFDVVRHAIRTLGLERIEEKILEGLSKADPRPLMAPLLANLRNLTTLYAKIPKLDMFFEKPIWNFQAYNKEKVRIFQDEDLEEYPEKEPASPSVYSLVVSDVESEGDGRTYDHGSDGNS
ncbi:hypothetical protein ZTR_03845 [Talaromyces verruculosus]|nr:hypothetical protein ZTR_03845 [Talaromyces verruculosus]